jgi:hypothetical protein
MRAIQFHMTSRYTSFGSTRNDCQIPLSCRSSDDPAHPTATNTARGQIPAGGFSEARKQVLLHFQPSRTPRGVPVYGIIGRYKGQLETGRPVSFVNDEAPRARLFLAVPGQLTHYAKGVRTSGVTVRQFRSVGIRNDLAAIVQVEEIVRHSSLIRRADLEEQI